MTTTEEKTVRRAPNINIRHRIPEDDVEIVPIRNEARPWLPPTSLEEYSWQADPANLSPDDLVERWVAEADGHVVGLYVLVKMHLERANVFAGNIGVSVDHRGTGIGSTLHDHLMERARALGVVTLYGNVSADDQPSLQFLEHRGYAQTGRAQRLSRLVIADANLEGYEGIYDKMAENGIEIKTVAEVGVENEAELRKIHAVNYEAGRDIPTTEPWTGWPFEEFVKGLTAPGNSPDQCWVAYDGDMPVGWASLIRKGDDSSFNGLTGVARSHRGKGIARALKLRTIEWARAQGIKTIFTSNDYENKPMLSINIPLGYVEVPAELEVVQNLV